MVMMAVKSLVVVRMAGMGRSCVGSGMPRIEFVLKCCSFCSLQFAVADCKLVPLPLAECISDRILESVWDSFLVDLVSTPPHTLPHTLEGLQNAILKLFICLFNQV